MALTFNYPESKSSGAGGSRLGRHGDSALRACRVGAQRITANLAGFGEASRTRRLRSHAFTPEVVGASGGDVGGGSEACNQLRKSSRQFLSSISVTSIRSGNQAV